MSFARHFWLRITRLAAVAIGRLVGYLSFGNQINDSSRWNYVYTPLDVSRREIRLLNISPGANQDVVNVSLRTVCLDDWKGRYTCISYAWGGLEKTKSVLINGYHHSTTWNLSVILPRLRLMGIVNDIWIDALCVDQNNSEMSYQVGMMAEIYTCAKEVYIGIETDCREDADQQAGLASNVLHGLTSSRHFNELINDKYSATPLHGQFQSLYRLLHSAWFTRAWTVQEVCLAHKTTFLSAEGCFTWKEVSSAFSNWMEHRKGCCYYLAASLDHDSCLREWLYSTYSHIQSINATVTALSAGQHIIRSLLYYQPMRASNPVDKYFAFRGLHTHQSNTPLPLPNYHHSKERVFTNLARWLLEDQRSLFVLYVDLPDDGQDCPSWVPDWSQISGINAIYRRIRLAFLELHDAAKGLDMEFSFASPGSLHLRGICVGEVDCVAEDRFDLDSTRNNKKVIDAWWKLILPSHFNSKRDRETFEDKFCLTLLGGCIFERSSSVREAQMSDIAQLKQVLSSNDIDSTCYHTPVMRSHIATVLHRRLFRLKDGRFGLGPSCLQTGDHVWILAGGPAPFALHKVSPEATDSRYRLRGHCYVDGIMKGEAVKAERMESCILE